MKEVALHFPLNSMFMKQKTTFVHTLFSPVPNSTKSIDRVSVSQQILTDLACVVHQLQGYGLG